MDRLLEAFEEELGARERALESNNPQPCRNYDRGRHTSTSGLVARRQEPVAGMTYCYCQQAHSSLSYTSVANVSSRKKDSEDERPLF